jgi:hypothetical protein
MFMLLACLGVFLMTEGLRACADDCSRFPSKERRRMLNILINTTTQILKALRLCRAAGLEHCSRALRRSSGR